MGTVSAGTKETTFSRDAQDRIIGREYKVGGATESNVFYSFTGSGDSPDVLLDSGGNVIQKYVMLPGDVIVTVKPGSTSAGAITYSLPNIHGDIYLTVDADGAVKSAHRTGPFGEALPSQVNPANTATGTSWNYVGQHQKLTDTETSSISGGIIQMGARVYIPTLGRFLSVDSVEGGTENNYVYANDPVNQFDLDGRAIPIVIGVVALQMLPRITISLMVRVAVRSAVSATTNYVAKKAAPMLQKKAIAASAKIGQVARVGASKSVQLISKSSTYLKSFRLKVDLHPAHHFWKNPLTKQTLWYKHVNVMIYRKGVSGSQKRIQIPYGKGCIMRNCK